MKNHQKKIVTATIADLIVLLSSIFQDYLRKFSAQLLTEERKYLSRLETATLLKISLPTLHSWTFSGKLHAHKIVGSSKVYYCREEVIHLISSSKKSI